jgi:hypothetical protein
VVLDERAVNRDVVIADPDGVSPASVRFSHRTGRYTLDAFARRRRAYGRPILDYQAIQFMLGTRSPSCEPPG